MSERLVFEHECLDSFFRRIPGATEDLIICSIWASRYPSTKEYPSKDQFEAMQREGYLPKQIRVSDTRDGRDEWVDWNYGEYKWDYQEFDSVAKEIIDFTAVLILCKKL